jgi:hypothetical protein
VYLDCFVASLLAMTVKRFDLKPSCSSGSGMAVCFPLALSLLALFELSLGRRRPGKGAGADLPPEGGYRLGTRWPVFESSLPSWP